MKFPSPLMNVAPFIVLAVMFSAFFAIQKIENVRLEQKRKASPCYGRQWKSGIEELDCRYPLPRVGRWAAAYTKTFALAHNLPLKNVSDDLSAGVDYMEMDVLSYNKTGVGCFVNMLVKRPNDFAYYGSKNDYAWAKEFNSGRKLAHYLDLDEHKKDLKRLGTISASGSRSRKYDPNKSYSIGSSIAFYTESPLPGYDYITASLDCRHVLTSPAGYPDKWSFIIGKASVWGKYESLFKGMNDPNFPQGQTFLDSVVHLNIAQELLLSVFEESPIGGR